MTAALEWMERRPWPALGGLVLLALLLRVGTVLLSPDYAALYDSLDYDRHASSIAAGNGYPESLFAASGGPSAFRPPLFPYLLGLVYAVAGDSITAGRLVEGAMGAALVPMLYLVGEAGWSRRVGLVAAAIGAVFPPLVLLNAALVSEPLFLLLELAAVWGVLRYRRAPALGWAVLAGLACGLGVLTRSNGLLLLLPLALGLWWPIRRGGVRALVPLGALAAGAALAIVPWTIRNAIEFDRFVPVTTQSGFAAAGEYNDRSRTVPGYPGTWLMPSAVEPYDKLYAQRGLSEAELDSKVRSRAREYILDHPGYLVKVTALNTLRVFELAHNHPGVESADLEQRGLGQTAGQVVRWSFYGGVLFALLAGALLWRRGWRPRGPAFLWLIAPLMVAAAAPFLGSPRYRTPLDPLVVLAMALAVAAWLDQSRDAPEPGIQAGARA